MYRINKEDYFIGVFVSTILKSTKGVPALFDATGKNKRVEFTTDLGDFNVYVKYSTGLSYINGRDVCCGLPFLEFKIPGNN
jgi:hypothetical protein